MQINRLFKIIYMLLDRKTITAQELAQLFEVSTRTIYRDIETLSAAGIPIYMSKGKGGGISLLSDFVLNKTVLTDQEKIELLASLKAVSSVDFSETDTVLKKLSSFFGDMDTDWIEVDFTSWYNAGDEKELFYILKAAILSKKTISFDYANTKGEQISREVYPLKLCFKGQSWYVYGFCKTRVDYRFFKLRRIKNLSVLQENFNQKAPTQIFNIKNSFDEEFITLQLKVSKEMAYRVYDEFNTYKQLPDGSFIGEVYYPKGEWLFSYIASFGEHCEVIAPAEIRLDIKQKFQKTLDHYL